MSPHGAAVVPVWALIILTAANRDLVPCDLRRVAQLLCAFDLTCAESTNEVTHTSRKCAE